ncbi:MAG: MBL fold metallo-hydrolase, partial [Sphingobium sp.]
RLEGDRWVPTFPNARYVLGKRDLDFFSQPGSDDLQHPAYFDSVLPVIEAGQADIIDGEKVILGKVDDGLWVRPAYGHSPGCSTVHARRGGPKALFCGDVLHHPIQLVRPDAHFVYDYDGDMAEQSRMALIRDVLNTDTLVLPAHFRFGLAGYIRGEEGALRYELPEQA